MRPALPTTLRHTLIRRTPTKARFASSDTSVEAAQQKAKEALNSAQKTAEKLGEGVVKLLGPAGQRAGNMLGAYREPLLYNLAVAREFVKQIYRSEGLQPPSINTIQEAYKTIWTRATNPEFWRASVHNGNLAKVGIRAVEAYGIFKIGEIIGRRSLIGYNIDVVGRSPMLRANLCIVCLISRKLNCFKTKPRNNRKGLMRNGLNAEKWVSA